MEPPIRALVRVRDEGSDDLEFSAAEQVTNTISEVDRPSLGITRDGPDHAIPINLFQLQRVIRSYLDYYHENRTHLGLKGGTPEARSVEPQQRWERSLRFPVSLGGIIATHESCDELHWPYSCSLRMITFTGRERAWTISTRPDIDNERSRAKWIGTESRPRSSD
jgi:hypothetical protein